MDILSHNLSMIVYIVIWQKAITDCFYCLFFYEKHPGSFEPGCCACYRLTPNNVLWGFGSSEKKQHISLHPGPFPKSVSQE